MKLRKHRTLTPRYARRAQRVFLGVLSVVATAGMVVSSFVGSPMNVAFADVSGQISIARVSASPQMSGSPFKYLINYTCSAVASETCEELTITVPLDTTTVPAMTTWNYSIEVPEGVTATGVVSGDNYVISFQTPVATGISQTVGLTVTPPNLWTANDTTWSLLPTASGTGFQEITAPEAADGTATAAPTVKIDKILRDGGTLLRAGGTVTYALNYGCVSPDWPPLGSLALTSGEVVDTLPEGLTFVSAEPQPDSIVDQVLTWSFDGNTIPPGCGGAGDNQIFVTAQVSETLLDGAELTNSARFSGVPVGKVEPVSDDDSVTLPVVVSPDAWAGSASISKGAVGALGRLPRAGGGLYPSTFAGNWITPIKTKLNLSYQEAEASFNVAINLSSNGFALDIVDHLPCLDNTDGAVPATYSSLAPGDEVCANPAFHPTVVMIEGWNAPTRNYPAAYEAGWRPIATDVSGTEYALEVSSTDSIENWVAGAQFAIPSELIGTVAKITFPKHDLLRTAATAVRIAGYADASVNPDDLLRNVVEATPYWGAEMELGETRTDDTNLRIAAPQIRLGVNKYGPSWSRSLVQEIGGPVPTSLSVSIFSPTVPTSQVVITDLLPIGMSWDAVDTVNWAAGAGRTVQSSVESIENFQGSGRQLLRFTIDPDQLIQGVQSLTSPTFAFQVAELPSTYVNTVQIFAPQAEVLEHCEAGALVTDESTALLDVDSGAVTYCEAVFEVRTTGNGLPAFDVRKSVQGNFDPLPRYFPAFGVVDPEGGSVTYGITWTNTGGTDLTDVVVYDVLPHVGDTGTLELHQSRESGFTPILQSVGTMPEGVTVSYSSSWDACRPELISIPGCVDDWSTTPPAAGLGSVKALKLTSSKTYLSGEGFLASFEMTVDPLEDNTATAWNSPAARASFLAEGGEIVKPILPAEAPKVGLQAPRPGISVVKQDINGADANSVETSVRHDSGEPMTIVFVVQNTGNEPLHDVTVSDSTTRGTVHLQDINCDFNGDGSVLGTEWAGPLNAGDAFLCAATLPVLPVNEIHQNIAVVTGVGAYSGETVTDDDPYNATGPDPSDPGITIVKTDEFGNDANDSAAPVLLDPRKATGLVFVVTNTGDDALVNVTVSDETTEGDAVVEDLSCNFPGDGTLPGITWAGPFAPGASFSCTGTLTPLWYGDTHQNIASVEATGSFTEETVSDEDPYNAVGPEPLSPVVSLVKADALGNDANDSFEPVRTGWDESTEMVFVVTNRGDEPLVNFVVSDLTTEGEAQMEDLSCDFLGDGTALGVTWEGPLEVGASFECTGVLPPLVAGDVHQNVGLVTAVGVNSELSVSDEDPYNAVGPEPKVKPEPAPETPKKPVPTTPLGVTGTDSIGAFIVALVMIGAGSSLYFLRRRKRS